MPDNPKIFTFSDVDGEHSVDENGWVEIITPEGEEHRVQLNMLWRGFLLYCEEHKDEFKTYDFKTGTFS